MSAGALGFRRLVLSQSSPSGAAARLAVEFADLFGAELLGLFIEDVGLSRFAAMPFAREIGALGGQWRPVAPERLRADLELAAARAERAFAGMVGARARGRLEVVRGSAATLAEISNIDDILVLNAPTAADWCAQPQAALLEAAFRSHAAVLLAPRTPIAARGAVAALAMGADDPAVAAARAISEAAGEPLDIIPWPARDGRGPGQRRLVVATRGALPNEAAIAFAARLRAPLLSLRPPRREPASSRV